MNVQPFSVTASEASAALLEYKAHRNMYDRRDWEIERIFRAISKGKLVISVASAIRNAGVDEAGRPRLAIARADASVCMCRESNSVFEFRDRDRGGRGWRESIAIPGARMKDWAAQARLPRIPPQHRPAAKHLRLYYILWEADWAELPRDPYLLRRIAKDAWVVLAAWDLTDVELAVIRSHSTT